MKLHSIMTIAWIFVVIQFAALEAFALYNKHDDAQPFTWYVRKLVGTWTSPLWFTGLAFVLWLGVHFFFVHDHTSHVHP